MSQLARFLDTLHHDTRLATYSLLQLKQAVILKILYLLGWDSFDLSKVQADHSAGGMTIDYALQTPSGAMMYLHIIKPLDDSTREQKDRVVKLAAAEGVRIAVLTDGVHWEFFAPMMRGTLNEKEFAKFSLHANATQECEHIFKHFLSYRIAVSGTAFVRAEKLCQERLKKKSTNMNSALSDAWAAVIQEFEHLFAELIAVEAKRLYNTELSTQEAQRFFSRFITLTTGELSQARRMKYDSNDILAAEAWSSLFTQLELLFVELIALDIEKRQEFIPEKEHISAFLHTLGNLHDQVLNNSKKLKTA
ncbi:MAG: hypothetical protein RML40_01280 [Bacteroidota bacterium]|nr:hypothetical protein [Candidatus Kapabacteria bacterium]MDW8219140.1 hypothetical protein [Bacteroidota bacterium]